MSLTWGYMPILSLIPAIQRVSGMRLGIGTVASAFGRPSDVPRI